MKIWVIQFVFTLLILFAFLERTEAGRKSRKEILIIKIENKPLDSYRPTISTAIRSDVIATSGFKPQVQKDVSLTQNHNEPGWIKRQLLKFGELTGAVGNKLGGFTGRLAKALDKVCEVVKTIIPVVAAVCHVGQFEFCGSLNEAPQELVAALAPENLDLSALD